MKFLKLVIVLFFSASVISCRNTVDLNPKIVNLADDFKNIKQLCQQVNFKQNFKYLDDLLNDQLIQIEKIIAARLAIGHSLESEDIRLRIVIVQNIIEQMRLGIDQSYLDPKYEFEQEWNLYPVYYKNKSERIIGAQVRFDQIKLLQLMVNGEKINLEIDKHTKLIDDRVIIQLKLKFSLFDLCFLNKTTKAIIIVQGKKYNHPQVFMAVLNFPTF